MEVLRVLPDEVRNDLTAEVGCLRGAAVRFAWDKPIECIATVARMAERLLTVLERFGLVLSPGGRRYPVSRMLLTPAEHGL